ncbi:aminotransferase class III-fold pyridoxal phosphate-dependent enzyme [Kineococcus sp. T13]|uniref:aminotransferase class III-fold pyridoxal phosphate-dependent enzyme n=1 Tax=Kineococcus vitellinus TaxID=2696565 RepID=UPI00141285E0|nr:aminotransferase class III-fold pyridoxal phosphate-dependent enzyme [Kineococcus vitellinus]
MPPSTILDGNSFSSADAAALPAEDQRLVQRRRRVLGPSYRLFYRRPVHLVRGAGTRVWDAEGREYLDAYNNVASIGHCHPAVVEAVHRQMGVLNTHSRYLQRGVLDYADQLVATFPAALDTVMFTNSGSEANDLAIRVARHATGGTGVVVTAEAYHGTTALLAEVSPAMGGDQPLGPSTAVVAAPDAYRLGGGPALGAWFAARITEAFDGLRERGVRPAAFLVDSIMASDGVLSDPAVLGPALEAVHRAGALFIADEVQPGFARTGSAFWGFARHGVVPDLVTLGKPMGNGIPVGAVVGKREVVGRFGAEVPYFNTFGGSSVPVAAARAVLDVVQGEGLAERSEQLGARLRADVRALAQRHPAIGDVRGAGLFLGVELVGDPVTRTPDGALALDVVNGLRESGVLVSVAGPHNDVLKVRPPLVSTEADVALLVERLDEVLTRCTAAAVAR